MTPDSVRLLTIKEAAALLGIGRTKMFELLADGGIPRRRLGERTVRIPLDGLKAWLDSQPEDR